MALKVSIVATPVGVALAYSEKSFDENGGSMGRGANNDWVLDDPDRFLSSRHCYVSFQEGQYYLTDTSKNGTFINGAPKPIGMGGQIPVNDGDCIELGDYQFRISLQPDGLIPNDFLGEVKRQSDEFNNVGEGGGPVEPSPSTPFIRTTQEITPGVENTLLEALGVSERDLRDEDIDSIGRTVGELIPVIVEGMMTVLSSCADIRNDLGVRVTTTRPGEINPLKSLMNAQESIENMLLRKDDTAMAPKQVLKEGFDGISEHQIAMVAGVRAALKGMIYRFNPVALERQFDKQNNGAGALGEQKKNFRESYSDYYASLVDNVENSSSSLFGDDFIQAYEDEIRRISLEKNQNKNRSA